MASPTRVTRRQIAYTYDDAWRVTSENRVGVGVGGRDELARYAYDRAGRLVRYTLDGAATTYAYDRAGNLLSDGEHTYTYDVQNRLLTKSGADGTVTYAYNAQNRLIKGENADGESSSYTYNALGARVGNVQVRENQNAGNQNADLKDGSHSTDYLPFLSDLRATWQRDWETQVGTVVQNDFETVTKHYVADYLSPANRDILVTEDGSFTQRYAYDADGKRLSVELGYADGTARGAVNADGDYGENPQSDIAVSIGKAWYRASHLNSTLFAVEADGSVVAHMIYDPWGAPLLETYTDTNYSGLDNLNNFTGYAYDEVLGFYFAQNRFYDAATHRFTQEDAIKDGGNWYAYCGNDPLNYVDTLGTYADLSRGATGSDVRLLQDALTYLGYNVGASGSDGSFGPATQAAVKAFNRQTAQRGSKHAASGIVDSVTWNTLTNAVLTKSSSGYFPVAICNSKRMGSLSAGEKTSLQTALGRMDSNAGANIFQELANRYAKGNATVGQLKGGLFQKVLVTNTMPVESNYLERSLRQFAYGNYTDNVTLLGTASQVAAGILDVDLPMDIRDIAYDLTHLKEAGLGQTLIDGVALLPFIGALKYSDEAGALLKHSDELADAAKSGSRSKWWHREYV